jgi:hypothetical protein
MDSHLTKTEKVLAAAAAVVIFAFFGFFLLINKHSLSQKFSFATDTGINYKMARPDQAFSEYTLEGRELDQTYEGLTPEKRKALIEKKKSAIAKAKSDLKKKEDEKKVAQLKQQKQVKEAQAKAMNSARQNQMKLQPQMQRNQNQLNDVKEAYYSQPTASSNDTAVEEPTAKKSKQKTYAEWRSIIFANPTSDNIGQFVNAYRKGEITATELQAMAQDLLDQSDNNYKGLGLAILRSVPSLPSLSQMIHAEAALPPVYQSYVEQAYMAYFQPQNVGYFNAALQTKDKVVQAKVLSLLQANLLHISQNDFSAFNDPRSRGATSDVNVSFSSFGVLVPVLTSLSANQQESDLASMAGQVLSVIQTHNNVAGNL